MTEPARTIIWIVSYPKSGNTWLRFLVSNLAFGLQSSAEALNRLAPDIHELGGLSDPPASLAFIKTHFPFSPQLPLAQHTAGAIYVVRHPADVMLSNYHYSRRRNGVRDAGDPAALGRYLDEYLASRGDPRWIGMRMGSWDGHVRSWLLGDLPFPVLPVRYEDLLADGPAGARQICAFLGLNRTPGEIDQAVAGASFRRMGEIEEADIRDRKVGVFYKPYLQPSIEAGLRFMRAGRAGESSQVLTTEQRRRVCECFGPIMSELGYNHAAAGPVAPGGPG